MAKFHVNISRMGDAYGVRQRAKKTPTDTEYRRSITCRPMPVSYGPAVFQAYIDLLLENEFTDQLCEDFYVKQNGQAGTATNP